MYRHDGSFWHSKWKILVAYVAFVALVAGVMVAVFTTSVFDTKGPGQIPQIVWFLAAMLLLLAMVFLLAKVYAIAERLAQSIATLEKAVELLQKNSSMLEQIDQWVRLSDAAKAVLSRQADEQSLRQAVADRLRQKDFDGAEKMLAQAADRSELAEVAAQLRAELEVHRQAGDQQRIAAAVEEIDGLLDGYQWARASEQIERLISAYPDVEQVKALRRKLQDRKQQRKKVLLAAWDDAVKRGAIDRSLEILKELDQYLTPSEALALQDSAKDVFKAKLHNLGVQFSLAVSAKKWSRAVEIGREIIRDFPNSTMADEIRRHIETLQQKIEQQPG